MHFISLIFWYCTCNFTANLTSGQMKTLDSLVNIFMYLTYYKQDYFPNHVIVQPHHMLFKHLPTSPINHNFIILQQSSPFINPFYSQTVGCTFRFIGGTVRSDIYFFDKPVMHSSPYCLYFFSPFALVLAKATMSPPLQVPHRTPPFLSMQQ